jgi:hypothetical protein
MINAPLVVCLVWSLKNIVPLQKVAWRWMGFYIRYGFLDTIQIFKNEMEGKSA